MNRTIIKKLSYIGAALNEGQIKKGVSKGPDSIRNTGIFRHLQEIYGLNQIKDYGNISYDTLSDTEKNIKPRNHIVQNLHLLDPILKNISNTVYNAVSDPNQNNLVLTVGGDHSVGSATIHGSLKRNPNLKVIWVDAHPDFVDPFLKKAESQNYHGMPLGHISGLTKLPGFEWMTQRLPFQNIVLIGIRDIEENQYINLREKKVKCFTMDHIDKYGIGNVMTMAMDYLDPKGDSPFHISFDVDGIDPQIASATGTLYRSGLNSRQACHIVRRVVHERKLVSFDLVQINEQVDQSKKAQLFRSEEHLNPDMTSTVKMGVDIISSLFEKNFIL